MPTPDSGCVFEVVAGYRRDDPLALAASAKRGLAEIVPGQPLRDAALESASLEDLTTRAAAFDAG